MKWPMTLPTDSIDALAYYGAWPHWPVPHANEAGLLRRMDRLALRAAVAISLTTIFGDPLAGNVELADLTTRHPGRLLGLATFDPRQPATPAQVMERGRDAGLRGLALFPAYQSYTLGSEPLVEEALWLAADWRWPVLIASHLVLCWWLPSTPIKTILDTARRHPRVRFIAAGVNYADVDHVVRAMGELNNIYLESSCAQGLDNLRHIVERGDPGRLLLGTGQPIQMPECNLVKVAAAGLDAQTQAAILRGNAARLFSL